MAEIILQQPIGTKQISEAMQRLQDYKAAKASVDQRIIADEQFWKMKRWDGKKDGRYDVHQTGWLWNVVMSKHADMMDGFPEANVRPKEPDDAFEATQLSSIVPVILESNRFRRTYSRNCRHKLGSGTAVYGILWDKSKAHGRGDIAITQVDVLSLFWEPGISDIQQSREVFLVNAVDKELLEQKYPQLEGHVGSSALKVEEYIYDDNVDKTKKAVVIDWYYKRFQNGRTVLHYCKFVDDVVLYATENETQRPTEPVTAQDPETGEIGTLTETNAETGEVRPVMRETGLSIAERGWYDHGKFPFVFDPLFDVEGSPCGYGYIDICAGTQEDIDNLNHAIVKNAILASKPRFFVRNEESINMEDFLDYSKDVVKTSGSLGEDAIRPITTPALPGGIIEVMNQKIEELKEVSGNRDVNNGQTSAGVTAASAIAALQESAGKTSRDMIANSYEAFKEIVYQIIELIRQFYDMPRQFRITGADGQDAFVSYSNRGLRPQQVDFMDMDLGYRQPEFDIEVSAQKATPYSKMSQNELALQFYGAGMFNPSMADAALAALSMMDFAHKTDVVQTVQQNGTLQQQIQQLLNFTIQLATRYEPGIAKQLAAQYEGMGGKQMMQQAQAAETEIRDQNADGTIKPKEHAFVEKAREQAVSATQVNE